MGVTILQPFTIPEGRTASQTIELLNKRIVALGAVQKGSFCVECDTYTSTPILGPPRNLHVLRDSEHPVSVFAMAEWTGGKSTTLVADNMFDLLMTKLAGLYTKKGRAESRGTRYEVQDFLVKLGQVSITQNTKGILVELEYQPSVSPNNCFELMREFMQGFLGSCVTNSPPPYLQNRMSEFYQPTDTIQQYLEHFNNYRKGPAGMR